MPSSERSKGSASTRSPSPAATMRASFCVRTGGALASFPGRRHGLLPAGPGALRSHRANREPSRPRARHSARARRRASPVNVWLVLLHNSPSRRPPSGVDGQERVRRSLCLQPLPVCARSARVCGRLCKDVTDNYPVTGMSLETPGFLPYAHGYHHEFAMVKSNRWLDSRLGLCFCDHCVAGATAAGIDAHGLRSTTARGDRRYLSGDIDFPDDMAEAFWLSDIATDGDALALPRPGAARS